MKKKMKKRSKKRSWKDGVGKGYRSETCGILVYLHVVTKTQWPNTKNIHTKRKRFV